MQGRPDWPEGDLRQAAHESKEELPSAASLIAMPENRNSMARYINIPTDFPQPAQLPVDIPSVSDATQPGDSREAS